MRALAGCALAVLASSPTWGLSNQKRVEHRQEAGRLVEALVRGSNLEGDLARVGYLGEGDFVASELVRALPRMVDDRLRQNTTYALSRLATRAVEPDLVRLLKDKDAVIRMNAAQGLGRLPPRAWNELAALLTDPSLGVRVEVAKALGASHAAKAGRALLAAARTEAEPEVRSVMLAAVGDCGDKSQMAALTTFLSSTSESTRLGAARGLCRLGSSAGIAFAKKLLTSSDRLERRSGLALLEGSSAKVTAPLLHPLLADPDLGLGAKAARILYQGGEARMLDWLVLASFHAPAQDKGFYERELELLQLSDAQRRAILAKADR